MLILTALVICGLSGVMTLAWIAQRRSGNGGWADAYWTWGTAAFAVAAALWPIADHPPSLRQGLVAAMMALWGLRLGLYLTKRSAHGPEDARYAHFRRQWGQAYNVRMWRFLQIQALAGAALVLTAGVAAHRPGPSDIMDLLGVTLWIIGWAGAALADRQLAAFKRTGHSGICDTGLWGWSRHPNYMFEALGWWGYALIAIPLSAHYPLSALALVGPVMMYVLLRYVSGVPPLEAHMQRSRPEAFADYQSRVPVFWPQITRAAAGGDQRPSE